MDYSSTLYPLCNFARNMYLARSSETDSDPDHGPKDA